MKSPIRVLIAEDNPVDAELVLRELRQAGFEPDWERVDSEPEFRARLRPELDLIISDFAMPRFSGLRALEVMQERDLDIPFILISGTIGEDTAVAAMQVGATDYLLKDRLARLGSAVRHALGQSRLRQERRQAETALRATEERFRESARTQIAILNALPAHIALLDPQGTIVMANEAWRRFAAANRLPVPDAAVGQNYLEICQRAHGESAHEALNAAAGIRRVLRGEVPKFALEYPCHSPSEKRWFRLMVTPLGESQQEGVVVMHLNVTERHQAEEALRGRTAFFEALVDSSIDGILVVDSEGRKILHNQRMVDLWKLPPQIAGGTDDAERIAFLASLTKHPAQFSEKVAHLYAHPHEVSRDEIELNDGTLLDRHSSPVRGKAGTHYGRIWSFRDLTERRKLEAQFRQSQKMEAIGQLAGGVAHDFNNILAAMMMQAELAMLSDGLPADAEAFLLDIKACVERAASLTRQLLAFGRRQVMQTRQLNLNELVTSLGKMLQRILGEDVKLKLELHPAPLLTQADAGMLDQVLMNLVVNARDAMPQGGRLTIETTERVLTAEEARNNPEASSGRHVCLRVSDSGCGIAPEILPRIFEPFFTTKEVGKGTGLGLATVFGIVKQHRGLINLASEVGQGTTFEVLLPADETKRREAPAPCGPQSPFKGTETILLVEDDEALRKVTRLMLERRGYQVLEAAAGAEALAAWDAADGKIQVLLTDIVMPGMIKGWELAARLQKQQPGLKVIFTSGYSADLAHQEVQLQEGRNFLTKPCLPSTLYETLRRNLDSQG